MDPHHFWNRHPVDLDAASADLNHTPRLDNYSADCFFSSSVYDNATVGGEFRLVDYIIRHCGVILILCIYANFFCFECKMASAGPNSFQEWLDQIHLHELQRRGINTSDTWTLDGQALLESVGIRSQEELLANFIEHERDEGAIERTVHGRSGYRKPGDVDNSTYVLYLHSLGLSHSLATAIQNWCLDQAAKPQADALRALFPSDFPTMPPHRRFLTPTIARGFDEMALLSPSVRDGITAPAHLRTEYQQNMHSGAVIRNLVDTNPDGPVYARDYAALLSYIMLTRPAKTERDLTIEIDAFLSHPNFRDVLAYHNVGADGTQFSRSPRPDRQGRLEHARAVLMAVMLSVEELRAFVAWQPSPRHGPIAMTRFVDRALYHGPHNALSINAPGIYKHLQQTAGEHFALAPSSELNLFWKSRKLSPERKAVALSLFQSIARGIHSGNLPHVPEEIMVMILSFLKFTQPALKTLLELLKRHLRQTDYAVAGPILEEFHLKNRKPMPKLVYYNRNPNPTVAAQKIAKRKERKIFHYPYDFVAEDLIELGIPEAISRKIVQIVIERFLELHKN